MVVDKITDEQLKLSNLRIFSEVQLKKLQEYSILTAEQFVGLCATPEGFSGVMNVLNLSRDGLNKMLYQVKNQLPTKMAAKLSKPTEFSPPLGARKPHKTEKIKSKKRRENST